MHVLPPEVGLNSPSAAEQKVHRLLRNVRMKGYTALHSLGLSHHDYKIVGEIDFLLVGPEGLLVLEVKGGRIAQREGVWIFTDRFGKHHRSSEGPLAQGKSAAFSLMDRLRKQLPTETIDGLVFGWAAVFPDVEFKETSVEWDPSQIIDESATMSPDAFGKALIRALDFWWDRPRRHRRLDDASVRLVLRAARPDFEKVPSLRRRTDDIEERALTLTDSQFRYLDAAQGNPRLLCEGGAGTGKTFLAVEVARREAMSGRSVTITCKSEVLAAFIADQPGLVDGSIRAEPLSRLSLCETKADVLIVDEAQDVINLEDLAILDGCVVGGLDSGRWRMFLDRNHQTGVLGSFEPEALDLVSGVGVASLYLPDNCRNTREVIHDVVGITRADVGSDLVGSGPPPVWQWWLDATQGGTLLAEYLQRVLEDRIEPHGITLLTGVDPSDDPVVKALPNDLRRMVVPLTGNSVHRPPRNRIGAARIGLFKGLENSFICVTDVPSLATNRSSDGLSELYVAMTRPRAGLFMCLHESLREAITDLADTTPGKVHS